jgi:hypothetical protein
MMDYAGKILKKKADANQKGIKTYAWLAPKDWFAASGGLKALKTGVAIVDPADAITIDGDHTFEATKGFIRAEIVLDGQLTAELVGDLGGHGFFPKAEVFVPGSDKETALIMAHAKDDDWIAIVELATDQMLQLGRKGLYAQVKPSFGSGTNSGGRNGWSMMIESYNGTLQYYEGDITEKPDPI